MTFDNKKIIEIGTFGTSIVFASALVGLSIYKLVNNEDIPLYIGMLSSIVGIFLPSPLNFKLSNKETSLTGVSVS